MKTKLILSFVVILAVFVAVSLAAGKKDQKGKTDNKPKPKENKQDNEALKKLGIAGPYGLHTDPENADMTRYLEAMGYSKYDIRRVQIKKKALVVFQRQNETHFIRHTVTKKRECHEVEEPGREYERDMDETECPLEKRDRQVIKISEFESVHETTFYKGGFKLTLKVANIVAILHYKKLALKTQMKGKEVDWLTGMIKEYFESATSAAEEKKDQKAKPGNNKPKEKTQGQDNEALKKLGISGPYGLQTDPENENMTRFLKAQGYNDFEIRRVHVTKKVLVVFQRLNETHFVRHHVTKKKYCRVSDEPGHEWEKDELECPRPMEKRDRDVMKVSEFESVHDTTFYKGGFKTTLKLNDIVVNLHYKKLALKTQMKGKEADWLTAMIKEYLGEGEVE